MPTINENFLKLEKNYLFINIAKKVNAFMAENPDAPLIRMGIGKITISNSGSSGNWMVRSAGIFTI